MGDDATNRWLFAGDSRREQVLARRQLCAFLKDLFYRRGYERAPEDRAADRSLVVGPASRFIWIGDSFDSIDDRYCPGNPAVLTQRLDLSAVLTKLGAGAMHPGPTPEAGPGELAPVLSHLGPLVKLSISDSAIIQISLYERGHAIDRYANGKGPFYCFSSELEARPWRGHPEDWEHLLEPGRTVGELRAVWQQAIGGWPDDGTASFEVVSGACMDLLGLGPTIERGYTWNPEGIPHPYSRWMTEEQRREHTELHFRWPGRPGRGHWYEP